MEKVSQFDGQIYLISFAPAVFEEVYMETGLDFGEFCFVLDGARVEEWIDQEAFKKCTLEVLERERKNPGYLDDMIQTFEKKKELYLDYVKIIDNQDLEKLSNTQLLGYYNTFLHLYRNEYALPLVTFLYKEHVSEMLYERLAPKLGEKTADALSCITTPEKKSFSFEERISILDIMSSIYDSMGKEIFEKDPEEIITILKKEKPHIYDEVVDLSHKYFWINNNYRRVFVLGALDFIHKMKDESLSFNHPSEELKLMKDIRETALQKKKEYLELLDDEEKMMAYLLAEGAWWQDERKKCNLIADHILIKFLNAVSKKTGIPTSVLLNATMTEIGSVLYGKANLEEIKERYKRPFSIYCKIRGDHAETLTKPGRRYTETEIEKVDEFRGTPASLGNVEGEVMIITKEEDFAKMKNGAILVSVMTRPEYVPIMKKAKGIITDEGGLTCHAAVVSREFGIPCIVGTKLATRVLKDGDIVELDAAKGIVKIKK